MLTRDRLWKSIIEDLFDDFLWFFFHDYAGKIDFSRPPEFLDKELSKIFPRSRQKGRVVDKLAKVWLNDGDFSWVIVHVEVQGYQDPDFPLRMFQARYRLKERFGKPVAAIAILTDDNEQYHPAEYKEAFWGYRSFVPLSRF